MITVRMSRAVVAALILAACNAGSPTATLRPTASATPAPSVTGSPGPTATVSGEVGYADLAGWIVFEHFGQAPDGSTSSFDFDRRMIWLVHANGTGLHELAPGKPAEGKSSPDISPDGGKIAFSSWTPPILLYEVGIDGRDPRVITTGCDGGDSCQEHDPTYSADGTRVAFVRDEVVAGRGSSVIMTRDLGTGQASPIEGTRMDLSMGYNAQPSWSRDGSQIVYYRSLKKESDEHITDARLFVATVDGPAVSELPQPGGAWAADPDWSPDGTLIVFGTAPNRETEGWEFPNNVGIWTIRQDGTGITQVCSSCLDGGWAPSWTPDGKHILFWGFRSWALMDPDGGNAAHINQPGLTWFGEVLGFGYAGFLQPVH